MKTENLIAEMELLVEEWENTKPSFSTGRDGYEVACYRCADELQYLIDIFREKNDEH